MLELVSLKAKIERLNVIAVSWEIKDTDDDLGAFHFTLGRSNSPGGPFESIAGTMTNVYQFFDKTQQMKSNYRKFYYRLTITDSRTQEKLQSQVVAPEAQPDFFLLEIRRRNDLYLRRFVGVPSAILIAKTFGQRCKTCWDTVKMRQRSSNCRTCFNIGYVGGYFPQINTYTNFSPNPELVQLLETGEMDTNNTNMWMSSFPLLSPRDIIVEFPLNKRWRVVTVGKTERLRATSRQIAQVVEVNRNDVEYLLPVSEFVPPEDKFLGFKPANGSGLL